jgi:hypothetical protein
MIPLSPISLNVGSGMLPTGSCSRRGFIAAAEDAFEAVPRQLDKLRALVG